MEIILNQVKNHMFVWQTLVGSIIGAIAPLFVLVIAEKYNQKKARKEYLYYLERMIVDQINMIIEVRSTTINFLDGKIKTLLANIDANPNSSYSVDGTFFPLFSVRPLPEGVNMKSSGSGYINNKVGKIYALSMDAPHIIDDIRLQLKDTLERNEKIAFMKLNPPEIQKQHYKKNLQEFEKMIREDILTTNIPVYLKVLSETLVAVQKKIKTSDIVWKIKFDPFWRFYFKKEDYIKARSNLMENMDANFKEATDQQLKTIGNK